MSSTSDNLPFCFKCCSICLEHCCSDWWKKRSQSEKYAYVNYTPGNKTSEESRPPQRVYGQDWRRTVSMPAITVPPEKLFSFPQGKVEPCFHPHILSEGKSAVTDQAKGEFMRRFSSTPTLSVGSEFSYCVDRPATDGVKHAMKDGDNFKTTTATHTHRNLPAPILSKGKVQRGLSMPLMDKEEWIPDLPVLQENVLEGAADHPVLQFSLHHDIQRCTLTVHLHHASNLPVRDPRTHTSNPLVVLYLIPNKEEIFQSNIIPRTLNPVFNQSFEFHKLTADDIRQQTLILRVYNHDKFSKNDSLGGVALPLNGADLYGVVMRMKIEEVLREVNEDTSKGDLLLSLCFDPQMGLLKGMVLKATNLKKQDIVGLADPYVKVNLIYQQTRVAKWKTTVKRNTLVPVFNESFCFDVRDKDIDKVQLKIVVMDYDRFTRNDTMGVVHLGRDVNQESGRRHWMDMLQSPQHSISRWHSVLSVTQNVKKSPRRRYHSVS